MENEDGEQSVGMAVGLAVLVGVTVLVPMLAAVGVTGEIVGPAPAVLVGIAVGGEPGVSKNP